MSKARGLADLGNVYNDGALSNRNLIINGAMQVAQRGTSAAGVSGNGYYGCDRWSLANGSLGTWDITQEADGPEGFGSSFKVAAATAVPSPVAAGTLFAQYKFEGQDVQQLKKGTSNALPLTLSFWVKSDKTGTYQVNVRDTSAVRQISATYTVDVSGTWEYKTITFDGDTSGVLANDNTDALRVEWWLASGTNFTSGAAPTAWEAADNTDRNAGSDVNLADTIGNYWQITGVQLEVGDTATPFEHRSYGQELALCQRYYYIPPQGPLHIVASGKGIFNISPPVAFRSSPTASIGRTNPYVENVPWVSVGNVTGIGLDGGHLNKYGGDLLMAGTYVQAHSYGDIWLLGSDELSLDAEL